MILPPDIELHECTYDPAAAPAWEAWLSAEERARLARFTHAGRREAFLAGRAAARQLLAARLGVAPAEVPLCVAPDGAVEVEGCSLHVSIAHSGVRAVAAAAEQVVGVDLEAIAERRPGVERFMLHPDEHDRFAALPLDYTRSLILYWAVKEATLKGLRTGLRLSPKKLLVDLDLAARAAVVDVEARESWSVRFEEQGGFFLAVAYRGA